VTLPTELRFRCARGGSAPCTSWNVSGSAMTKRPLELRFLCGAPSGFRAPDALIKGGWPERGMPSASGFVDLADPSIDLSDRGVERSSMPAEAAQLR
jgi:hypothetical protein